MGTLPEDHSRVILLGTYLELVRVILGLTVILATLGHRDEDQEHVRF